jgi:hypothetical protein
MITNTALSTDADGIEALADAVGVLRRVSPLRYETPVNSCALCGTPCAGVMCLSCATR